MKPYSQFVNHPLDETYLSIPGDVYSEGDLPPEETEVRKALVAVIVHTQRLRHFSFWARMFKTSEYSSACSMVRESQRQLMERVNHTPLHKAALRRIVSAMPEDNGGRDALRDYLR